MLYKKLHIAAFLFLFIFTTAPKTFSQNTDGTPLCPFNTTPSSCVTGDMTVPDCKIHNATVQNPYPPHDLRLLLAGTHCANGNGGSLSLEFYSMDIRHNVAAGIDIQDSGVVIDTKILYILYHYQEYNKSAPGQLSIDEEVAAVQLAIHHFDEALDLNTMDTTGSGAAAKKRIHSRANFIAGDANLNATPRTVVTPIKFIPEAGPNDFRVKVLNMDGGPQSGITVNLCVSDGSAGLSLSTATTNASGLTPVITYTGPSGAYIGATAMNCRLPTGMVFVSHISDTSITKKLVLTGDVNDNFLHGNYCDRILFGVLPVELASFTAAVSGRDVTLNWKTNEELNNSGFEIYRTLSGSDIFEKIAFITGHGTSHEINEYALQDRNLNSGRYTYRIKQMDLNGNFKWYYLGSEVVIGIPEKYNLGQNYPNPFNPSTSINYDIPADGKVVIKVYSGEGKEVAELVNENKTAGYYSVSFNGSNLPSGIYFYKMEINHISKVKKMALIK